MVRLSSRVRRGSGRWLLPLAVDSSAVRSVERGAPEEGGGDGFQRRRVFPRERFGVPPRPSLRDARGDGLLGAGPPRGGVELALKREEDVSVLAAARGGRGGTVGNDGAEAFGVARFIFFFSFFFLFFFGVSSRGSDPEAVEVGSGRAREVAPALGPRRGGVGVDREEDVCLLYTSPSPRDATLSRMPSSA